MDDINIDYVAEQVSDEYRRITEQRIMAPIGLYFRQTVRVTVRRPRWMPDRVYRWLMRTIVVEMGNLH